MRLVITRFVERTGDWCAYYDGDRESGPYGWGDTAQKAIDDLTTNYPEDCDPCRPSK